MRITQPNSPHARDIQVYTYVQITIIRYYDIYICVCVCVCVCMTVTVCMCMNTNDVIILVTTVLLIYRAATHRGTHQSFASELL